MTPQTELAFERAEAGPQRAAGAWTPEQRAVVDDTIAKVASVRYEFSADDIWAVLPRSIPVNKGLASRLSRAVRRGLIRNTGTTRVASRGGEHDHAQRLTVWASLVVGKAVAA